MLLLIVYLIHSLDSSYYYCPGFSKFLKTKHSKKQEIQNVCAFIQKLKMERPNHTIYINNLNEKVKKEGKLGPTTI